MKAGTPRMYPMYGRPRDCFRMRRRGCWKSRVVVGGGIVGSGGTMVVNYNFINSTSMFTLVRDNLFARVILVSTSGGGTRKRTVSVDRNVPFTDPVGVCTKSCSSITSTTVIIVSTKTKRGPKRAELSLMGGGMTVFGSVVPRVAGEGFTNVVLMITGPMSVLARMTVGLSKLPRGEIVKSNAILSDTELECGLNRRLSISDEDIRTFVMNRRKSDRIMT